MNQTKGPSPWARSTRCLWCDQPFDPNDIEDKVICERRIRTDYYLTYFHQDCALKAIRELSSIPIIKKKINK